MFSLDYLKSEKIELETKLKDYLRDDGNPSKQFLVADSREAQGIRERLIDVKAMISAREETTNSQPQYNQDEIQKLGKLMSMFEVGKKYTIFRMSGMAMTGKQEIEIVRYTLDDDNPVYKLRGKRKEFQLFLMSRAYSSAPFKPFSGAVFAGWDQPITCDSEMYGVGCVMRGNACYNFYGSVEPIKEWINKGQINPYFERSRSLAVGPNMNDEELVFPEEYVDGTCAPIDRLIERKLEMEAVNGKNIPVR